MGHGKGRPPLSYPANSGRWWTLLAASAFFWPPLAAAGQSTQRCDPTGPPARDTIQFSVPPRLLNRDQVVALRHRAYPPELRDKGIAARGFVFILVSSSGHVEGAQIAKTTGYQVADSAALRVARFMEFAPAYAGRTAICVWVRIPMAFETGTMLRPPQGTPFIVRKRNEQ